MLSNQITASQTVIIMAMLPLRISDNVRLLKLFLLS